MALGKQPSLDELLGRRPGERHGQALAKALNDRPDAAKSVLLEELLARTDPASIRLGKLGLRSNPQSF